VFVESDFNRRMATATEELGGVSVPTKLDPETLETLKRLHKELELEDAPDEPEEQYRYHGIQCFIQ